MSCSSPLQTAAAVWSQLLGRPDVKLPGMWPGVSRAVVDEGFRFHRSLLQSRSVLKGTSGK